MTDDDAFELSRRKALAGIGTIGVASAGAGLGTSAFFSDTEEFTGNRLTAGSLDLKVDWEEHYSDWSDDEGNLDDDDPSNDLDIQMTEPSDPTMYQGLPDPNNPLIWVHLDDLDEFQDNTSIEAMPDTNNDGIQDDLTDIDVCARPWDTDAILDPTTGPRTANSATEDVTRLSNGEPAPLINLNDVKPGDFGELTLSLHLCDNPGYVWLTGELLTNAENGVTEPEVKDPDEDDGDGVNPDPNAGGPQSGELADAIQTMFWYDEDGDNVYEPGGVAGKVDVMIVLDTSGSMAGTKITNARNGASLLANTLDGDDQLGFVTFGTDPNLEFGLTDPTTDSNTNGTRDVVEDIQSVGTGGFTNIDGGLTLAEEELDANGRGDAEQVVVLLSDGIANRSYEGGSTVDAANATDAQRAVDSGNRLKNPPDTEARVFSIAYDAPAAASTTLQNIASPGDFFDDVEVGAVQQIFAQIAQSIEGEKCFLAGSLSDTLDVLSSTATGSGAPGVPLDGNRANDPTYAEVTGNDNDGDGVPDAGLSVGDPTGDGRDCFINSTTQHIGFAWWLPVDHANEIQTDSVSFDLGFYTEQCRHNDGTGMEPETPVPNGG